MSDLPSPSRRLVLALALVCAWIPAAMIASPGEQAAAAAPPAEAPSAEVRAATTALREASAPAGAREA